MITCVELRTFIAVKCHTTNSKFNAIVQLLRIGVTKICDQKR